MPPLHLNISLADRNPFRKAFRHKKNYAKTAVRQLHECRATAVYCGVIEA